MFWHTGPQWVYISGGEHGNKCELHGRVMLNIGLGTSVVHIDDAFADLHVAPAIAVTSSQCESCDHQTLELIDDSSVQSRGR